MTTNKYGIVALSAMMMLVANCGGPDDNPDGSACTGAQCTTPNGGCTTNGSVCCVAYGECVCFSDGRASCDEKPCSNDNECGAGKYCSDTRSVPADFGGVKKWCELEIAVTVRVTAPEEAGAVDFALYGDVPRGLAGPIDLLPLQSKNGVAAEFSIRKLEKYTVHFTCPNYGPKGCLAKVRPFDLTERGKAYAMSWSRETHTWIRSDELTPVETGTYAFSWGDLGDWGIMVSGRYRARTNPSVVDPFGTSTMNYKGAVLLNSRPMKAAFASGPWGGSTLKSFISLDLSTIHQELWDGDILLASDDWDIVQ